MSDVVIKAENLGKKYIIGHQASSGGSRYSTLRDSFSQNARSFLHKTKELMQGNAIIQGDTLEEVWVLRDINFEVHQGEAIGIIGRNGAGKSTLLKVLSRITEPSAGRVTIHGRVASLLEVGTGFHPELSGRENVYLNGAILGMTRQEIKSKFDEIVAFAEVEKYLDTPVKRYSSGMYVRLAFAVAAHLEPEILVVDEVLAVGDAEFQKKCLGKMSDVASEGRTVLFVSHNMGAISTLCRTAILLEQGRLVTTGKAHNVVAEYMVRATNQNMDHSFQERKLGDDVAQLLRLRIVSEEGKTASVLSVDKSFGIEITYTILKNQATLSPDFLLSASRGEKVFHAIETSGIKFTDGETYRSIAWIPANFLNDESYTLDVAITTHNPVRIHCQTSISFEVLDNINAATRGDYRGKMHGVVRPHLRWDTEAVQYEKV